MRSCHVLLVCACAAGIAATDDWTVVTNADDTEGAACTSTSCVLVGTVSDVDACRKACVALDKCVVFSFNHNSHHCYSNTNPVWKPLPNDHVDSGCKTAAVPGCGAPAPPPQPPGPPAPSPPPPGLHYDGVIRSDPDGSMVAYMIPPYKSNHASTLEQLPDGSLVAAWFSGEKEEASGCAIVFAKLPAGSSTWSSAATLAERDDFSNQNPVLFYDNSTSILHLFHSQAPAESGESESQIWHLQSSDAGATWTKSEPFFTAAGDFPRNRIIRRKDGTILFPYYSQAVGHPNWSVMGISMTDAVGSNTSWKAYVVDKSSDLVQPSVVRTTGGLAVFFRDRNAKNIYRATSVNEGVSWTTPKATPLPNNNAGIEAYTLHDGRIVIAFNPQTSGRDPLAVALSADSGLTWPQQRNVQHGLSRTSGGDGAGNEFSYPTILQDRNGTIHMMYTYLRETIKYKSFNPEWISSTHGEK